MQQDESRGAIKVAIFTIGRVQDDPSYRLIADNAHTAGRRHGVKVISRPGALH